MAIERKTRIGNYEVISLLGAGGMGQVYVARDLRLNRQVALKLLPDQSQKNPLLVRRFLREARAASALNHPNIVTIYETGHAETGHYIVMELIEGKTLRQLIGQTDPLDSFLKLSLQMIRGLGAAHNANIIHRDIKPENVMVRSDGYLKILDFGLARTQFAEDVHPDSTVLSLTDGAILGSPRYMSPEQARGEPLTPATDIFSTGIVFYEFATGHHPFGSETTTLGILNAISNQPVVPPSRLKPDIPRALEVLILRMLDKNPRLRPAYQEIESILAAPISEEAAQPSTREARRTVGREEDRARLDVALSSALTGKGSLICVEGEAGIGKTTLVEDFLLDTSSNQKCWIGRGRCSERLGRAEAFLPVIEAIESLIFAPDGASFAHVMKLLAPVWYGLMPSAVSKSKTETEIGSQDRIRREFVSLLQEGSRIQPILLFIEDLHWADLSTIDLLVSIVNRISELPVLIIVTYRAAEMHLTQQRFLRVQQELQTRGISQAIPLDFLSRQHVQKYIDLEFPDHDFPSDFVNVVHARTEGNPLFMVDVLRYLKDQKLIVRSPRGWALTESVTDISRLFPDSLRGLIQRSIDSLSADHARLLVAASVQGYEFHATVIAKVLDLPEADVEEELDKLDRIHGFIRAVSEETFPDGTLTLRFRFVHVLYQDALFLSLKPARRVALSTAAAIALQTFFKGRLEAVAAQLGFLFEAGRKFDQAASYFLKAAQTARSVFAFEEAALLARRGLAAVESQVETPESTRTELFLRLELGASLSSVRGFGDEEAQQTLSRTYELRHVIEDRVEVGAVLMHLFDYNIARLDIPKARLLAEELVEVGKKLRNPALTFRGEEALGSSFLFSGDFSEAVRVLEDIQTRFEAGEFETHFRLYTVDSQVARLAIIARCRSILGFPDQAFERVSAAVKRADSLADPLSQAWAYFYAALISQMDPETSVQGKYVEALRTLSTEHGLKYWLAHATCLRGYLKCREGHLEKGIVLLRAGREAVQLTGSRTSVPYLTGLLAEALGQNGEAEAGIALIESELADPPRLAVGELCRIKAELLMQFPARREEADHWFQKAITIAREQSAKLHELRALSGWLGRTGRWAERENVKKQLTDLSSNFTEGFTTTDLLVARRAIDGQGAS